MADADPPDVFLTEVKSEELVRVEGRLVLEDMKNRNSPVEVVLPNLEYAGSIQVSWGIGTVSLPKLVEIGGRGSNTSLGKMAGLYSDSTADSYPLKTIEAPVLKIIQGQIMFCACPKLVYLDFPEADQVTDNVQFYGCPQIKRNTLFKAGAAALAAAKAAPPEPPKPKVCEHCKNFGPRFCREHGPG